MPHELIINEPPVLFLSRFKSWINQHQHISRVPLLQMKHAVWDNMEASVTSRQPAVTSAAGCRRFTITHGQCWASGQRSLLLKGSFMGCRDCCIPCKPSNWTQWRAQRDTRVTGLHPASTKPVCCLLIRSLRYRVRLLAFPAVLMWHDA